jgi:hypothetical protein
VITTCLHGGEEGGGVLCEMYLCHVTKRGHETRVMVKDRDLDTEEDELNKIQHEINKILLPVKNVKLYRTKIKCCDPVLFPNQSLTGTR